MSEEWEYLKAALSQDDWRIAPRADPENRVFWYAWRSTALPDCESNRKPPVICVYPSWLIFNNGQQYRQVEVSLTGELMGQWFSLKAYSIPLAEAVNRLPAARVALESAWMALANLRFSERGLSFIGQKS